MVRSVGEWFCGSGSYLLCIPSSGKKYIGHGAMVINKYVADKNEMIIIKMY